MDKLTSKRSRLPAGRQGFSTLEIMLAIAIALMVISAVFPASFGFQSAILGGQTNSEAVTLAQQLLEEQQSKARQDFTTVGGVSLTSIGGTIYSKTVTVTPSADSLTDTVEALISWLGDHGQPLYVKLTTLVTNPAGTAACTPLTSSADMNRWTSPQMTAWEMVKDLVPAWPPANNFIIEDVTPYQSHLFVIGGSLLGSNRGAYLLAFKTTTDPTVAPTYLTGANVSITPTLTTPSAVSDLPQQFKINNGYAYIASGRDYCTTKSDCGQLIVVDVSKVETQALSTSDMSYYKISGASGSQGVGKSVYYNNGVLYVGLNKCPTAGCNEFNVLDVGGGGAGGSPANPQPMGSFHVGAGVSSIYVSGNYAYLATDDKSTGNALMVIDLATYTSKWTGIFGSSFGYANAVALSLNPLYLGFTYNSSNPELYILDNPDPATQKPTLSGPGLSLGSSNGVASLLVKGNLAFLVTSDDFEIWNVSSPGSISSWASPISYDGGGSGTASGCSGNTIWVGSRPSSADKAHLAVFYPSKLTQTITVNTHAPATAAYNSSFSVAATASSGLTVTESVAGVCSVSGSTITMTSGSGTCTITYNQSGNYNYSAATVVTDTTAATKADQTITVSTHAPSTAAYGSAFSVAGSASSGLAVAVTVSGGVCTVSGNTVTMTSGSGTCTVRYNQTGNTNYNAAPEVTEDVTATKAPSTTSISCPASVTYNGAAQVPCTYTVTGSGLSLGPTPVPAANYTNNVSVGTASVSYTYAGDANHTGSTGSKTFSISKATPIITWSSPADITYGTALSATQLNASTGVAGTFTYTPPAGTILNVGAGQTLSVHFVPTDTANYNTPSDKTVTITVNQATPTVATVIKPSSTVTAGTVVHDEVTLTSTVAPTGTVDIVLFKNGTCGGGTLQTTNGINLVGGFASSPNFTTAAANKPKVSYQVTYHLSSNYVNPATSCQQLTVN